MNKSKHNCFLVFILLYFKLTTCFGLFVRPSSGNKIHIVRGSYTT